MENVGQLFYKSTIGKTFQCVKEDYHGMETCQWTWKKIPPPSKERVDKMDEVDNANFSFNKKSSVDVILQKKDDMKSVLQKR